MAEESLRTLPMESKLVIGLVSGSEFMNHMFLVLLPPVLGLLAADFDVSLAQLGLAIGVLGAMTTLFQLPFGYISDRYNRVVGLGLSLGLGTLGTLVTAFAPSYAVLVVGQAIIGIGVAGHHPSHFPLLSDAVPGSYRGRSFSYRGFAGALGFATPPLVTTIVLALPGTTWRHAVGSMGLLALGYAVVTLVLFRWYVSPDVKLPDPPEEQAGSTLRSRLGREIRSISAMPAVLALALFTFVGSIVSNGFRTYVVVHLTDGYGATLGTANLTLTAIFVAGAVMMLLGGNLADRIPPGTVMVGAYALVGVLLVVVASLVIPTLAAIGLVILVEGLRSGAGPARSKLVDTYSSRSALGQSFAVMTVGMMLGGTVAPPVFGAMIESVGLRATFLAMAAVAFVALAIALTVVMTYDDEFSLRRPLGTPDD